MGDVSLAQFLSRPVRIIDYDWTVGSVAPVSPLYDPWSLFLQNPRVANRINNYNLLRCKLKIKVTLNGNPFYYGRAMVVYSPRDSANGFTVARPYNAFDFIESSQRPHIFLDPSVSQGGVIELPFVHINNTFNLPLGDYSTAGRLYIAFLNPLKHANGADKEINIQIFAWAEDVVLSSPTAAPMLNLTPQAGDEYATHGMVSTPAAVLSNAAAQLANIPSIKPYALASQMVLSTVASLARLFGYSRPLVPLDIAPMRPTFGNFANSNASDTVQRLTLDQKAETTIDSRVVGLSGHDEMSIKSIAAREAYWTAFNWTTTANEESLLWNCRVTPSAWNRTGTGNATEFHLTPMCFAALPFRYWRGSLKYRFQIVSSGFHQGRLKFVWDPHLPASNEYNTNYVRIVDISEEKDFCIVVGWGNNRTFLEMANAAGTANPQFSTTPYASHQNNRSNGVLSVYVVNGLTAPNSTVNNDISINVFVSAHDDFEVVSPNRAIEGYSYFPAPAGFVANVSRTDNVIYDNDTGDEEEPRLLDVQSGMEVAAQCSTPLLNCLDHTVGPLGSHPDTYKVVFGDPVASVRQLVKRYAYHSSIIPDLLNVLSVSFEVRPDFPAQRGFDPNGMDVVTGTPAPANYVKMTALNWFTPAYLCRRGGLRWKYYFLSAGIADGRGGSLMNVTRDEGVFTRGNTDIANTSTPPIRRAKGTNVLGTLAGTCVTPPGRNPVLEVDLPYYTFQRFYDAKASNIVRSTVNTDFHRLSYLIGSGTTTTGSDQVWAYVAAADDFDLSFFVGTQILFAYQF